MKWNRFQTLAVILSLPVQAQDTFTVQMPIRLSDVGTHFGLNPFGAHIGNHALDGHPGWDIEYRIGSEALAAAAGVVQSVYVDRQSGAKTIQLEHRHNNQTLRTVYTNLRDVDPAIVPGAPVAAGQSIGIPAVHTQTVGVSPQTWASIHFQLDDFTVNRGLTNPSAVSPEAHLSASGRSAFDAIWKNAAYGQEICEPFPSNSRNVDFPLTRTWTRQSGDLSPRIDFTCVRVQADSYRYTLFDSSGRAVENGRIEQREISAGLTALDFRPDSGGVRHAVLRIVNDTMLIDLSEPGSSRAPDIANASVYRTTADPLKVTSAASYAATALSPEAIVAAFGSGLAPETVVASTIPLPTTLASTRVKVRDSAGIQRDAALYSVSPSQVNFIVPAGTAIGLATIMVTSGDGTVFASVAGISMAAPGLFTADGSGTGVAAALVQRVRPNGSQTVEAVVRRDSAQGRFVPVPIDLGPDGEQVFLNLYGTGIRFRQSVNTVGAFIGGIAAPVTFAGAQADSPGLDQINLLLPRALGGRGDVDVVVAVDGKAANAVSINLQ